jgi:long-chain acyl-CoA synthetase
LETAEAFEDGWFHTGDLGSLDEAGRLLVRGRKKEVIVTPEGLNVFPEDVERAIERQPGVRESAVVGVASGSEERVHAVVVLEAGADADRIVRDTNKELEEYQRIRGFSVWTDGVLPRTEGTRKLKRGEIKRWVAAGGRARAGGPTEHDDTVESILQRFTGARQLSAGTTLEELGLTSLERIELMMALEERFQTTLDETAFSGVRDVRALQTLVEQRPARSTDAGVEPIDFPSWNRTALAGFLRRISLPTWILPLARVFAWPEVSGLEHLSKISGPVIFASNHQSHMDTPVILWVLPSRWRYRVAPAMAKEFFKAHFFPEQHTRKQWLTNSLNYYLSALFFNAFPLPQREAGTRQTLRYAGELLGDGFSILIYPEGKRTERGEINQFRPGIGMMAARLGVPVVPVRLEGLDRVLHQKMKMAKPGRVRVAFGEPLRLSGEDYVALAKRVEEAVRAL